MILVVMMAVSLPVEGAESLFARLRDPNF